METYLYYASYNTDDGVDGFDVEVIEYQTAEDVTERIRKEAREVLDEIYQLYPGIYAGWSKEFKIERDDDIDTTGFTARLEGQIYIVTENKLPIDHAILTQYANRVEDDLPYVLDDEIEKAMKEDESITDPYGFYGTNKRDFL